jgi:hypothetical protein
MGDDQAGVAPFQPWPIDGFANVAPLSLETTQPEFVDLKNFSTGNQTVDQDQYHNGIVLVNQSSRPQYIPSTLPLKTTTSGSATVEIGSDKYPNGVVVLFK